MSYGEPKKKTSYKKWLFTESKQLIGLQGTTQNNKIFSIGVLTFDTMCDANDYF